MGQLDSIKEGLKREAPMIFSLSGIAGFVTSTVLAVRATPAAIDLMEEYEPDPDMSDREILFDKAKLLLPVYGPAIASGLISTGMIIGSLHISKYRYNSMASLWFTSQLYLQKLNNRMIEEVGEKKAKEISVRASGPTSKEVAPIHLIGEETILCYDSYSGRYFTTDSIETIRRAVNDMNEELFQSMFVSINDFYYEIGLDNVEFGDQVGWFAENGSIKISFDAILTDKNKPCVVVQFTVSPRHATNGYRGGH